MRSNRVLKLAVACTLAAASSLALAQTPPSGDESITELETVIVTGTYIRGAATDAALPVDVISSEDLLRQGSPSMIEIVKALPASQGVIGEANQFSAGYSLGSANVNLRGLGSARTLVLMNGRRIAPNPAIGVGVDVNLLPVAAIGRIEVLKDGAAATYGSDAVAGVVNFITRTDLEGLDLSVNYSYIPDSDGEYSANAAWGWKGDTTDLLFTAGYRHRSELAVRDRDWALKPYSVNPSGGWTGAGNPGTFTVPTNPTTNPAGRIVDPQCANLGGVLTGSSLAGITSSPNFVTATGCQTQFLALDNLIEDEDHFQVFAQVNQRFGESVELHVEGLYAEHNATEHSSPSYLPSQGPTGANAAGVMSTYFVPYNTDPTLSNPGYVGWLSQLTANEQAAVIAQGGVGIGSTVWRPFLVGGSPLTGGAKEDVRDFNMYRFSVGLRGDIGEDLRWDTALTYGETENDAHTPDIYVARMDLALRGLGGPNCNGTVGTPGCLWLNPFSTAVARNVVTGQASSVGATVPNSVELVDWLFGDFGYVLSQSVLTADVTLDGTMGLSLPGGYIGWAAGVQYRENGLTRDPEDDADPAVNPCPQSIVDPAATCPVPSGVLSFNSPLYAYDLKQEVKSVYAELSLPFFDSLDAQLAVRFEDYGGGIGNTTNPKLAISYRPLDMLTFRGSVGTTFRAPAATTTVPGLQFTGNAFVASAGRYLPFDTYGNPNLKPEQALAFNVGTIVRIAGFTGSIDYWSFALEDALVAESGADMITAFFTPGAQVAAKCLSDEYAGLRSRFTFNTGVCGGISTLSRVRIQTSNSQDIDVSGIDADFRYDFSGGFGRLAFGVAGTYNLEYKAGAVLVEGIQIAAERDYVGTRGGVAGSQPRWKGSAYVEYGTGSHNLRWTARHVASMYDIRSNTNLTAYAGFRSGDPGSTVEKITLHDLSYLLTLPSDFTVTFAVTNVFDKDPSFARTDLNYDAFTGNPVGRVAKVGLAKHF